MTSDEIRQVLETQPLAIAVRQLMQKAAPAAYRQQIASIEKELEGVVPGGARPPLKLALEQLKEAERQAGLPHQMKIIKAVSAILKNEGLAVGKVRQPAADPSQKGTRPRIDPASLGKKVLNTLPKDPSDGLPGNLLAKECGVSYQTMLRYLVDFQDQGMIVRQGSGASTTWHRAGS